MATGVVAVVIGGTLGAALIGGVVGVAATAGKLAFDSIVQRDAPDANRGRLFAKFETRFQLIWVVGAMLGLVPLDEVRLSFGAVALVAGFATFSYAVGLTAWRHRSGEADATFGRHAVRIDQAMTHGRERVRSSSRSLARRVIPGSRSEEGVPPPPDPDVTRIAGPGIGAALEGSAPVVRPPHSPAPGVEGDPTRFAPGPPPPSG